ncbi:hypothetical protein BDP27DRAFT_1414734 [Rhodocollybia butyracea]|uniref:Pentatricopeptide repeat protein n=1 Tax=Rhodocollybia butyracea TaxID=206335 RepID=A0A9P5Q0S3_9AGAR|nr:hypothetical protein BDP27DRAFT_1414734 [Rhodocollybia butyracea]
MLSRGWSRFLGHAPQSQSQSISFLSILQNAAGQAWLRRATGKPCHSSTVAHGDTLRSVTEAVVAPITCRSFRGNTHPTNKSQTRVDRALRRKQKKNLRHFPLELITEADVKFTEPGQATDASIPKIDDEELGTCCIWGDPSMARWPAQRRTLPRATSRVILYRNLTRLLYRTPPITLPQLMDYHDIHPEAQSTRSYNLLISMAIRTASFGSVQLLLENMAAANISHNLETHKLVIRWQIRIGEWDAAWQILTSPPVVSSLQSINEGNDSPCWPDFLWLEFFGSLKRRSLRRKGVIVQEQDDPFILYSQRFLQLMEDRPFFSPTHAKPRIIHSIAYVLLQINQPQQALQLVKTYFSHLPANLSPEFPMNCLDIIHIFIISHKRGGVKKFHEHRSILLSLLALHPSFKPTSTTLFLLLGSLRGVVRSGVLASECLASFKRKWGPEIEDYRVRLRIASLALKQGRLDISRKMLTPKAQNEGAVQRSLGRRKGRPRFKDIFRGIGKLKQLSIRLKRRMKRLKRKRSYPNKIPLS